MTNTLHRLRGTARKTFNDIFIGIVLIAVFFACHEKNERKCHFYFQVHSQPIRYIMRLLLCFSVASFLFACSPKVRTSLSSTYTPLNKEEHVTLYEIDQPIPPNMLQLGFVEVRDNGVTVDCGWDRVVEMAKAEARQAGGNALKIIEHNPPKVFGSSCHQIVGKILRSVDEAEYASAAQNQAQLPQTMPPENDSLHQKVRVSLHGGWSWLPAPVSDQISDYLKPHAEALKSGYHAGASYTYYFLNNMGIGAKYALFLTSSSTDNVSLSDPFSGNLATGILKDDISTHFFGPAIFSRIGSAKSKVQFVSDFSVGYFYYLNKGKFPSRDITFIGQTVGFSAGLGFDFALGDHFALILYSSAFNGALSEYRYQTESFEGTIKLPENAKESLHRLDFSIGVRWSK